MVSGGRVPPNSIRNSSADNHPDYPSYTSVTPSGPDPSRPARSLTAVRWVMSRSCYPTLARHCPGQLSSPGLQQAQTCAEDSSTARNRRAPGPGSKTTRRRTNSAPRFHRHAHGALLAVLPAIVDRALCRAGRAAWLARTRSSRSRREQLTRRGGGLAGSRRPARDTPRDRPASFPQARTATGGAALVGWEERMRPYGHVSSSRQGRRHGHGERAC